MTRAEEKTTYQEIVALNLLRRKLMPGDTLTVLVRNEDSDESMFTRAEHLSDLFLLSFNFFPQEIAMHPDHLSLLTRQGRRLDITLSQEAASLLTPLIDLADLPRRVPMVADPALDLFTLVARYTFQRESAGDLAKAALRAALPDLFGPRGRNPL